MSVTITINGTPIEFPSTGESPNWAPALIEFSQAVEGAFERVGNDTDIAATVIDIPLTLATGTPTIIEGLSFPTTKVRAAAITYSVIRQNSTLYETGSIFAVYNGSAWTPSRDYIGNAKILFTIDSNGQVYYTLSETASTTGGQISFSAKTLSQV